MRLTRIAWVLLANGVALYFAIYGAPEVRELRSLLTTEQPLGPSWQDYLRGVIPAAGIVLEIWGLWIAKYVNIGYFALLTIVWGVVMIYNWSDSHAALYSGALFCFSLVVTGVDLGLYWKRTSVRQV